MPLAFYWSPFLAQGKQVTMVVDDSIPEKFSFLSYVDCIKTVEQCQDLDPIDMLLVL